MSLLETLRTESRAQLRERIVHGHPVDPTALEGWAYRGTSLGLPRVIERLTWKTFQKTFWREPVSGRLLGWNVRLEQDGLEAPSRPKRAHGVPVTTGHYEVIKPEGVRAPAGFDRGLIIRYGALKDPLVAVEPGNSDLLLGVSYVTLGPLCVETPTYFLLEREHPIDFVPRGSLALTAVERRWAEVLFETLLGSPLPDTHDFWRQLETRTPPYFALGLRGAVHLLSFLPLSMRGFRRPLFALKEGQRLDCIEAMNADVRAPVRQSIATAKILACFAFFEGPLGGQRAPHPGPLPLPTPGALPAAQAEGAP